MKIKLRDLQEHEVTFTTRIEPEDTSSDECFATDDPEWDAEQHREIKARLNRGDTMAWCVVVVEAAWNGIKVTDCLGGCNFGPDDGEEAVAEFVKHNGLREEALQQLKETLQDRLTTLMPLVQSAEMEDSDEAVLYESGLLELVRKAG